MSLLREIQDAVVDSKSDLPTVLRKCKILSYRLKNSDFKNWVQYELDGYPEDAQVPDYRICHCQSKGNFSGPFGSGMKNAPIPMTCIPSKFHEILTKVELQQGVTALMDLVDKSEGNTLHCSWPHDILPVVGMNIYENMNLMQAWREISVSVIIGILDTVRNRILNFVLEIEEEVPENQSEEDATVALSTEKVHNIFNNYIMGNVGNIASGGTDFEQVATISIQKGNLNSLETYLDNQGISAEDIENLKEAIEGDPRPSSINNLGPKLSSWIGNMLAKASQGMWKVGLPVASNLLSQAIAQYYGIQ